MEKYDFYEMGIRYAKEEKEKIEKVMEELEKEYGEDAKTDFEAGVITVYDQYRAATKKPEVREGVVQGTKDFGIPNTRNNSYTTGAAGSGIQYKTVNGNRVYNEPNVPENPSKNR